ncbi:MAG: ATP-binding protein [Bacteroidota bacterium]
MEVKYIERIKSPNFLGDKKLDWKLRPDVNVLSGENGSGKSTILRAVYELLTTNELGGNLHERVGDVEIQYDNKKETRFKRHDLVGTKEYFEKEATTNELYKDALNKLKDHEHYDKVAGFFVTYKQSLWTKDFSSDILKNEVNVEYVNILEQTIIESGANKAEDLNRSVLNIKIEALQFGYLDFQLDVLKQIRSNGKKNKSRTLAESYDLFVEKINAAFGETGKSIDKDENSLSFIKDRNIKISTSDLSGGEKQLLICYLTVLFQRDKQSILLLDEPETSLHFHWQKNLITDLRELNPNLQLIIATHSPGIIINGYADAVSTMDELLGKS